MRPAGKGPLESLYFEYPLFEARPVPELQGSTARHAVVIVGAGPIGMTAALTLARYGIPSVLLERKDTFNDGSRAICIARPSMQILQQIGAVEPFLAKALGWRHGRSYYRGQQIFRLEMPHADSEKYLPMYNLQQQYIEQYLWEAVARQPLIETRWCSNVTGIDVRADAAARDGRAKDGSARDGVTLHASSPLGDYRLEASYVLAADGARSPIRAMLGLRLKGENYEGRYVIADVRMQHDFPTERRAFFEPASNPGGTVLIHKQPDDIWRIDYQLREVDSDSEAIKEANIRQRVGAILTDIGHTSAWDLEWWSLYTANTLCLDDYRHGPVFFIGDSAHIVPIFGVRGLNNGLADAYNIGWKLGLVLSGEADARLLDSYSPERRGATLDVFENAAKSTRFMTPPTRGWTLARDAALSLAIRHEFPRELANPRQMQPYTYANSPLSLFPERDTESSGGPVTGSAAPNARLTDGGYLLDRTDGGFIVLMFGIGAVGADGDEDPDWLASLRATTRRLRVLRIGGMPSKATANDIADPDGAIARIFGAAPGTVYLLRPDLHVAGRWRKADAREIVATLRACLGHVGVGTEVTP